MKLVSLTANQSSFHPVIFKDGINIIVGKQALSQFEIDGNTYNGVGKTLVMHLVHFCLGSNPIDSFSQKLKDWEFTLKFSIKGNEYYAKRNTTEQNKIEINGEVLKIKDFRQKMFKLCFDVDEDIKYLTWISLFSRFVRRYRSCYSSFDGFTPKETDYSKLLNNCYLLGLDTSLIIQKKELREKQKAASDTENAIKNDPLFRQYYLGRHDAEIDVADLRYRISELEKQINSFKISKNYHELEVEANKNSYQKKQLENRRVIVSNNIQNIEEALQETARANDEKLIKVYEATSVEVPDMVKKDLGDVLRFHRELVENRNDRLRKELNKQKAELKELDSKITELGVQTDELLFFLNTHGALDEYIALTKQLASLQNELNRIEEYQKLLKTYKDTILDLKTEFIVQDKEADSYLGEINEKLTSLMNQYSSFAKRFYPKKRSGLSIKNNSGENMLRYSLDARIEDDSSDGVNEVRIFCFDLLILLNKVSNIRFLIHDSRLFANMDHRQRAELFRILNDVCKTNDIQYVCSVNEDALLSVINLMSDEDYKSIISDNVILELEDDAPESKLLGIQVDIDLEDKSKKVVELS
jgi:uncharacterized protein YydD (DUF2326 family)